MKLSAFFCLCLMVIMLFSIDNPVSAEIYQFTDENGNTYYTNDPVSIPNQYRDCLNVEGEIVVYGDPGDEDQPASSTDSSDQEAAITGKTQPSTGSLSETEAFRAREIAFNNEFKALQEERKLLDQAKHEADSSDKREELNAATINFNNKYKDFHRRRQAFKEEVRLYNEQVREDMKKKLEQFKVEQTSESEDGDL